MSACMIFKTQQLITNKLIVLRQNPTAIGPSSPGPEIPLVFFHKTGEMVLISKWESPRFIFTIPHQPKLVFPGSFQIQEGLKRAIARSR